MALVTLKTFDTPIEAHLLKAQLENVGIWCFLFDEHLISLFPYYNLTLGGIKLKVNEEDVEICSLILKENSELPFLNDTNEPITCMNCSSTKVNNRFKSFKGFWGTLSLCIAVISTNYPFYWKWMYNCKTCGKHFKPIT